MIKVDQLKGKTEIPESMEVELSALIDVKGMKAMGNRISQHPVKSVALIAEINPEVEEVEPEDIADEDIEPEDQPEEPASKSEEPEPEPVKAKDKPAESSQKEPEEPASKSEEPPKKKIDFEITNPDDIDIDDKGQLGLF
jgi:topoisomerase-4 subunit A